MSHMIRSFSGSGTVTASYVPVGLLYSQWKGETSIPYFRALNSGPIGITIRNTHASLDLKYKVTATDAETTGVDAGPTPANNDPTDWPVIVAETTVGEGQESAIEIDVAHHLYYAICVIDGDGHATYTLHGQQKEVA
jgi:hypothetical protein